MHARRIPPWKVVGSGAPRFPVVHGAAAYDALFHPPQRDFRDYDGAQGYEFGFFTLSGGEDGAFSFFFPNTRSLIPVLGSPRIPTTPTVYPWRVQPAPFTATNAQSPWPLNGMPATEQYEWRGGGFDGNVVPMKSVRVRGTILCAPVSTDHESSSIDDAWDFVRVMLVWDRFPRISSNGGYIVDRLFLPDNPNPDVRNVLQCTARFLDPASAFRYEVLHDKVYRVETDLYAVRTDESLRKLNLLLQVGPSRLSINPDNTNTEILSVNNNAVGYTDEGALAAPPLQTMTAAVSATGLLAARLGVLTDGSGTLGMWDPDPTRIGPNLPVPVIDNRQHDNSDVSRIAMIPLTPVDPMDPPPPPTDVLISSGMAVGTQEPVGPPPVVPINRIDAGTTVIHSLPGGRNGVNIDICVDLDGYETHFNGNGDIVSGAIFLVMFSDNLSAYCSSPDEVISVGDPPAPLPGVFSTASSLCTEVVYYRSTP